jgi:hypothetical protein
VYGSLRLCSRDWKETFLGKVSFKLFELYCWHDPSIHSSFFYIYDGPFGTFNRWEVAVARRRVKDKPTLPNYLYQASHTQRHIRLLRLKRRILSAPSCEVIQIPLENAPVFEAISYTRGNKDPSIPLEVDGAQVLVTSVIDELLFYRRSIFGSKLLWIDAICINQSDMDEKNTQLPLMTQIYTRASRVVVWLSSPESVGETFNVRKLLINLAFCSQLQGFGISSYDIVSNIFRDIDWPFMALGPIFSRSWFERMWVLQEVAVGETVHVMYSGVCVEWDVIATVAKDIESDLFLSANIVFPNAATSESSPQGFGLPTTEALEVDKFHWGNAEIMHCLRGEYQQGNLLSLDLLLPTTLAFKSKDPRDRIFAILEISSDAEKLPFKPNYKDSAELVYVNTTRFLLSIES